MNPVRRSMQNEESENSAWECHDILCGGLRQLCQNDSRTEGFVAPHLPEILARLFDYVEQIELHNPAWGLVGTNDRRELIVRHILDSLAPMGIISGLLADANAPGIQPGIADVGSGAGLPGIPLAVTLPEVQFTLIERSGRRAVFLRNTLAELGLGNITVEEAEMEKVRPGRFDVVTFRALRALEPKILKKLFRLCGKDGVLAAYKGRKEKIISEMGTLEKALPGLAGQWDIIPCPVPLLEEERHLVLIKRMTL